MNFKWRFPMLGQWVCANWVCSRVAAVGPADQTAPAICRAERRIVKCRKSCSFGSAASRPSRVEPGASYISKNHTFPHWQRRGAKQPTNLWPMRWPEKIASALGSRDVWRFLQRRVPQVIGNTTLSLPDSKNRCKTCKCHP